MWDRRPAQKIGWHTSVDFNQTIPSTPNNFFPMRCRGCSQELQSIKNPHLLGEGKLGTLVYKVGVMEFRTFEVSTSYS